MATWWKEQCVLELLVEALNDSTPPSPLVVVSNQAFVDDKSLMAFGNAVDTQVWVGGDSQRTVTFLAGNQLVDDWSASSLVIAYERQPNILTFHVPRLPLGEIAVLTADLPKARIGSNDAPVAPAAFIRGLKHLTWKRLLSRYQAYLSSVINAEATCTSLDAGQRLTEHTHQHEEAETYDLKFADSLELTSETVAHSAWSQNSDGRPVLGKLIASGIPENADRFTHYAEKGLCLPASEANLVFGVTDDDVVVGLHIPPNLSVALHKTCFLFPPLTADEVLIKIHDVDLWPKNLDDIRLQVQTSSKSLRKTVLAEKGKAWVGLDKTGGKSALLRIAPAEESRRVSSMEEEDDYGDMFPGAGDVVSAWTTASLADYPPEFWKRRSLLQLTVRIAEEDASLNSPFFQDAQGFAFNRERSLTCFGVWLRLRPVEWISGAFRRSDARRILIGDCFNGETPGNLFHTIIPEVELCLELWKSVMISLPSSTMVVLAIHRRCIERVLRFNQAWPLSSHADVVCFVDLVDFTQQKSGDDLSFIQLHALSQDIYALQVFFNVVEVAPVLKGSVVVNIASGPTDLPPLSEGEKKELARRYFKREDASPDERLAARPNEFLVWTQSMERLYVLLSKDGVSYAEVAWHMRASGVSTLLHVVTRRLQTEGFTCILERSEAELRTLLIKHASSSPHASKVLLIVDGPITDAKAMKELCKRVIPRGKFVLVCTRHVAAPTMHIEAQQIPVTPMWSQAELEMLVRCLNRGFDGTEGCEAVSRALHEALHYSKSNPLSAHMFLFVFVATTGEFRPPIELIKEAWTEVQKMDTPDDQSIFANPSRVFNALAFACAVGPLDAGVPYGFEGFDVLLDKRKLCSKLLVVRTVQGSVSSRRRRIILFVHPFFARIHLCEVVGATLAAPLPDPVALYELWKTVGKDLKGIILDEDRHAFFQRIFVSKHSLSLIARHFADAKSSAKLIQMTEGYLEQKHHEMFTSELLRYERAGSWEEEAIQHAKRAVSFGEDYMVVHNLAVTYAVASTYGNPTKARVRMDHSLENFKKALGMVSLTDPQRIASLEQVERYFGDSIRQDDGNHREWLSLISGLKPRVVPIKQVTLSKREWRFLQLWSDTTLDYES